MESCIKKLFLVAALTLSVTTADAAVVMYTWEEDGDVKSEWSGTLDMTGLVSDLVISGFDPLSSFKASEGAFLNRDDSYARYLGASVNMQFVGPEDTTYFGSFSGDMLGYLADRRYLFLSDRFQSADSLSGQSVIEDQTLFGIGVPTLATVEFTWTGDSITHYYGVAPASVPLPAGLPLLAAGLGALGWMRQRARKLC